MVLFWMAWPFRKRTSYTEAYKGLSLAREDVGVFNYMNGKLNYFYSLLWDLSKDENNYYQRRMEAGWILRLALKFKRFIKEFRNFLFENNSLLYTLLTNPPVIEGKPRFVVDGRIGSFVNRLFDMQDFFNGVNEENIKETSIQNKVLTSIADMIRGHMRRGPGVLHFILYNCRRAIMYERNIADVQITKKLGELGFEN